MVQSYFIDMKQMEPLNQLVSESAPHLKLYYKIFPGQIP